jgi:nitrate reductase molybdenum cofactor assembly chaperone NarJ/NarW
MKLFGSSARSDAGDSAAWLVASHLLDYPDEALLTRLPMLRRVLETAPRTEAALLGRFADHLEATPLEALQAEYVDTFDTRRRCNLFLTYFAFGDTRKRGMALLRFKQTYQAHGVALGDHELPDHLCVVLEFAATVDLETGRQLLLDHRAGVEVLRMALGDLHSPWADVVTAICSGLPALRGEEAEAVQRLAEQGPPEEEVGLTPYGATGGPIDLPMPTISRRGA